MTTHSGDGAEDGQFLRKLPRGSQNNKILHVSNSGFCVAWKGIMPTKFCMVLSPFHDYLCDKWTWIKALGTCWWFVDIYCGWKGITESHFGTETCFSLAMGFNGLFCHLSRLNHSVTFHVNPSSIILLPPFLSSFLTAHSPPSGILRV